MTDALEVDFPLQMGWRYVSINDGRALCRKRSDGIEWDLLNASGKWSDGTHFMMPYIYNGEIGAEDVTEDAAQVIAEKLGGSIDV